jgi:hypothetical protein
VRFCTTLHAWGTLSDRNGVQGVAGSNPAVPIGSKFQSLKDFGRIAPTAGERKGWLQSMRGVCRRRSAWPPTWCGAEMANSTPDAPNVGAAVHRKTARAGRAERRQRQAESNSARRPYNRRRRRAMTPSAIRPEPNNVRVPGSGTVVNPRSKATSVVKRPRPCESHARFPITARVSSQ